MRYQLKTACLTTACLLYSVFSFSQSLAPYKYPQGYFRDPLAIPMSLVSNFGELRPDHYHMGLDIRTQRKENLPVFAAADGYIARIAIEPAGFGQAIYIRHPNGYTTVYGHLNKFFPALAAYVAREQYKLESWQLSLEIPPDLFPVKKGDLIALSGNTGGSQGPHLHFEIRQTEGDINLNPLLFGLPVHDAAAPTFLRLAWYDRNLGIYEQSPHLLPVKKTGLIGSPGPASPAATSWTLPPGLLTVPVTRISFAISAFDTQTGAGNTNGIFQAILYDNDQPVIGFEMDSISYDNSRNINAHIDYKTRQTGGPFLQHLSFLQGYPFPSIYRTPAPLFHAHSRIDHSVDPSQPGAQTGHPADGIIDLSDGRLHEIHIIITDPNGNYATLAFKLQYRAPQDPAGSLSSVTNGPASPASSVNKVPAEKTFYPGMVDGIETSDCAFYLGEKSLYDSVNIAHNVAGYPGSGLSLPGGVSAVHTIGNAYIPLLEPLLVRIRPSTPSTADGFSNREWTPVKARRIVMVNFRGTQKDVQSPQWQGGWASARFRHFGNFQLVEDTVPPVITLPGLPAGANPGKGARIAFSIKDNLGALRNFRAELDGRWLCFTNDKGLAYIYKFDQHCPPGRHTLKVSVEDVAGNKTVKEYHFTR